MYEKLTIWLDFDGTVVEHAYPSIGQLNPNAPEVIEKLRARGHRIILNTKRIDFEDNTFEEALDFLKEKDIEIDEYTPQKLYPSAFSLARIAQAQEIYIDDMATNIPLTSCIVLRGMMVDWTILKELFLKNGIIDN